MFIKWYIMCKYTVASNVHILKHEKPSPTSPAAKLTPSKPAGTTCLIWKAGLLGRVVKRFSARSCSPWHAKTSQMGVSNPATPKYEISCPNIPPNVHNSERNHPPATSGIVYTYLLVSPTPIQQSRPITHPRPSIRHPRHINQFTRSPKGPYY